MKGTWKASLQQQYCIIHREGSKVPSQMPNCKWWQLESGKSDKIRTRWMGHPFWRLQCTLYNQIPLTSCVLCVIVGSGAVKTVPITQESLIYHPIYWVLTVYDHSSLEDSHVVLLLERRQKGVFSWQECLLHHQHASFWRVCSWHLHMCRLVESPEARQTLLPAEALPLGTALTFEISPMW